MWNRRTFIRNTSIAAAFTGYAGTLEALVNKHGFSIGACDWSLGKNSDPEALTLAKQIGLDGVMVNMGSAANNLHLRNKDLQQQYLQLSKKTKVKISSIAIGELNNVPYKSAPETEQWVWDSVDTAKNLGVPVVLLAFFSKNDLRNDKAGTEEVISRLKKVAPHAEKNKIILGIESYLNADEHRYIIDKVGSSAIKVYYDFRNTQDAGYDPIAEFKKLGREMICELHMKENGILLGEGTVNWKGVREVVAETNFKGDNWMQIEWAKPDKAEIVESYKHNHQFLQSLFQS
jgi:L-ribulose-5-phosphate 3-epimerase